MYSKPIPTCYPPPPSSPQFHFFSSRRKALSTFAASNFFSSSAVPALETTIYCVVSCLSHRHQCLASRRDSFAFRASSSFSDSSPENQEEASVLLAREAVAAYLQELGISTEDSLKIVLSCPKYLEMLIGSVRDLDELSLWNSWSNNSYDASSAPSFRNKVYEMAKHKGDNGILPLLESLGFSLPSATHLARYLSADISLPSLLHKVKYVKEIFFSDSEDEGIMGKSARRMMFHLSISVDDDVQQTLSFFEKVQARRGGLDFLASSDAAFRHLIESFPHLLLLPIDSQMKPMMELFEAIGVPDGYERNILLLFPPIIFYDIDKCVKPRLHALQKVGAGNQDFGRLLLKYPWILSTRVIENYEKILYFFHDKKVPEVKVLRAIKNCPYVLGSSVDKLKLMVEEFGKLGISNKNLGKVIASSPQLLLQKPQKLLQVVAFMKDLGLDDETVCQILCRCPEIFATSIESTLARKLEFLSGIGVSESHFPRVIRKYPEFLVCDIERALLPRMKYLMKAGLSKRDVAFMVRRFSPLLGYSIDKVLKPKLEFLVGTMKKPLTDVVDYPRYFSYSLEKKIKPRYWLLKSVHAHCSLEEMLGKNDEEFTAEFLGRENMLISPLK